MGISVRSFAVVRGGPTRSQGRGTEYRTSSVSVPTRPANDLEITVQYFPQFAGTLRWSFRSRHDGIDSRGGPIESNIGDTQAFAKYVLDLMNTADEDILIAGILGAAAKIVVSVQVPAVGGIVHGLPLKR